MPGLISLNVFWLFDIDHIAFSPPRSSSPAPPRLHWLSDIAVGGAWAAVARAFDGFSNLDIAVAIQPRGFSNSFRGALRPGLGKVSATQQV